MSDTAKKDEGSTFFRFRDAEMLQGAIDAFMAVQGDSETPTNVGQAIKIWYEEEYYFMEIVSSD